MKTLIKLYNRWRYRRLYRKLFFLYANKHSDAAQAVNDAAMAFEWLCGFEYADLFNRLKTPQL